MEESKDYELKDISVVITKSLQEILKIENVDENKQLSEYGLDSITNTDLINNINAGLNINLMPTIFYELNDITVNTLSTYIYHHFFDKEIISNKKQDKNEGNKSEAYYDPLIEENVSQDLFYEDLEKDEFKDNSANTNDYSDDDIVIVGMNGKFPKSNNLEDFWHNLEMRKSMISEIPKDRFDSDKFNNSDIRWGSFLNDVKRFDGNFFGISNIESNYMDPQHRLFMEIVWNTLEDAGYKPSELSGKNIGVFAGISTQDYSEVIKENDNNEILNPYALSGITSFMLVNRISSYFNFTGPSEPIDTACSSSLVALDRAICSINNNECDAAIVGGVNLILSPSVYMAFSSAGMLNNKPYCKVFDNEANGTLRGEGIGAVFIKKYKDAKLNHDHIYCVIRSSTVNHKGKTSSLTATSIQSQIDLIVNGYKNNNIDPKTIDYIEAHSTGTKIGDPIEINALTAAYSELGYTNFDKNGPVIGSLKSYVGHMEAAAGIGALIKVILSMKNELMLGVNNLEHLNEYIDIAKMPFRISSSNRIWKRRQDNIPRRAAISAFGFGGVNAHIVIDEYLHSENQKYRKNNNIFCLSAKSEDDLIRKAREYINFFNRSDLKDEDLNNICFTLQIGREDFNYRLAFKVNSIKDINSNLIKYINKEIITTHIKKTDDTSDILDMLFKSKDVYKIIKKWTINREIDKLIKLWLNDYPINWKLFYSDSVVNKISLPTYPFYGDIHWIDKNSVKDNTKIQKTDLIIPKNNANKINYNIDEVNIIDEFESKICDMISNFLDIKKEKIKPEFNLQKMGVDSIILTQLLNLIRNYIPNIKFEQLYSCKTIQDIFDLYKDQNRIPDHDNLVIKLNNVTKGKPVFWFHGGFGGVEVYRFLASKINRPFYGIQARGYMSMDKPLSDVKEMSNLYCDIIKSIQKIGPYDLGGLSFGGVIAYEVAKQLQEQKLFVNSLVMLESIFVNDTMRKDWFKISNDDLMKDRILRVTNLLLSFSDSSELIDSNKLNIDLTVEKYIDKLVKLAKSKGMRRDSSSLRKMILQLTRALTALDIAATNFKPQAMLHPEEIKSYYFCNNFGSLFGNDESYYRIVDKGRKYDYEEYFYEWKKLLPNLELKHIKSSSHLTVLTDDESLNVISNECIKLYNN